MCLGKRDRSSLSSWQSSSWKKMTSPARSAWDGSSLAPQNRNVKKILRALFCSHLQLAACWGNPADFLGVAHSLHHHEHEKSRAIYCACFTALARSQNDLISIYIFIRLVGGSERGFYWAQRQWGAAVKFASGSELAKSSSPGFWVRSISSINFLDIKIPPLGLAKARPILAYNGVTALPSTESVLIYTRGRSKLMPGQQGSCASRSLPRFRWTQ